MSMEKVCSKCGKSLPIEQFVLNKDCRGGRAGQCRECKNKLISDWKRKNSERLAARRRALYALNAGADVKMREERRRSMKPYTVRAQLLRGGMRDRSKLLGLPFDSAAFTTKSIIEMLKGQPSCPCCGVSFNISFRRSGAPMNDSPSMDRIRPELGYVVGNVALICWRCNNLKRDSTPDELQRVVDWMRSVWAPM